MGKDGAVGSQPVAQRALPGTIGCMIRVSGASKDDSPRLVELHVIVHGLHAQQRPHVFATAPEQEEALPGEVGKRDVPDSPVESIADGVDLVFGDSPFHR